MRVRIIAGQYGGRWLDAPDNRRTHPMGERIRNALFNSIGSEVLNAHVLDAFAGTGAVGLEALSRGASHVTFIERDPIAYKILAKNVNTLAINTLAKPIKASLTGWIKNYKGELFDIIIADPPYHDPQLSTVSQLFRLLKPGGLMVLSHTGKGERPNLTNEIVVVDNRGYGNAHLTFFRQNKKDR